MLPRRLIAAIACFAVPFCLCLTTVLAVEQASDSWPAPIAKHQGKVLVLLLGMPGCPGTKEAMAFLNVYAKEKPEGAEVLRLDVPPPEGKLPEPEAGIAIPHQVDEGRKVAMALDFFFYPTLYLLDKEGGVRFSGGCEPDKVRLMVADILAEKPGGEKKLYTPPLLPVGKPMPDFAGKTLAGEEKKLADLRGKQATLLLFGATSCPFSNDALTVLPRLLKDYAAKGAAIAAITRSPESDETRVLHAEKAPGITVLVDPQDKIGKELCHVPAVPFFFVLDAAGNVSVRQPFTEAGARAALDATLGLKPGAPASGGTGAG